MGEIGERLRQKRLGAGFASASEAARRYGWNENTYRSHENTTRNVPRKWLLTYAKVYGVSLAWLTTGQEEPLSTVGDTGQIVPVLTWAALPKVRGPGMSVRALRAAPAARHIAFGRKVATDPIGLAVFDDAMTDPAGGRLTLYKTDDVVIEIARLVAANPAYPAFDLPADSHHILGVVVAVQRSLVD